MLFLNGIHYERCVCYHLQTKFGAKCLSNLSFCSGGGHALLGGM